MNTPPRRRKRARASYRTERAWSPDEVRALRQHLGLTQQDFSDRLGMRQQTISEWEVGKHRPRGGSLTLLNVIAESAGFSYRVAGSAPLDPPAPGTLAPAAASD